MSPQSLSKFRIVGDLLKKLIRSVITFNGLRDGLAFRTLLVALSCLIIGEITTLLSDKPSTLTITHCDNRQLLTIAY